VLFVRIGYALGNNTCGKYTGGSSVDGIRVLGIRLDGAGRTDRGTGMA
jgi:hypothetical protein